MLKKPQLPAGVDLNYSHLFFSQVQILFKRAFLNIEAQYFIWSTVYNSSEVVYTEEYRFVHLRQESPFRKLL